MIYIIFIYLIMHWYLLYNFHDFTSKFYHMLSRVHKIDYEFFYIDLVILLYFIMHVLIQLHDFNKIICESILLP